MFLIDKMFPLRHFDIRQRQDGLKKRRHSCFGHKSIEA